MRVRSDSQVDHADASGVRILTRGGYDWAARFPAIEQAARDLGPASFIIDGEAVVLDEQGRSDFNALQNSLGAVGARSGNKVAGNALLYAFDLLYLDGRDLRTFGSAGQQRSAAIALRMLEVITFKERTGRTPVFLLDDPFAELDIRRSSRILDMLTTGEASAGQQIILAVPRARDIPRELTGLQRLSMSAGRIAPFEEAEHP